MADSPHGPDKISKEQFEHLLAQRNTEIARLRRLAGVFFKKWENYPELKKVTTRAEFAAAREKNPRIPETAWADLVHGMSYLEQANSIEKQPLPEIAPPHSPQRSHRHDYGLPQKPPEYLDHDVRYQQLLEADPLVARFREKAKSENNEKLLKLSSIAKLEDGVFGLNPEIIPHLTALDPTFDGFLLEERARAEFKAKFPKLAETYEKREKLRLYKDPKFDPELIRLNRRIKAKAAAPLPSGVAISQATYTAAIRKKELLQFTRDFPQKAIHYLIQLPELKEALLVFHSEKPDHEAFLVPAGQAFLSSAFYQATLTENEADIPPPTPTPPPAPVPMPNINEDYRREMPRTTYATTTPSSPESRGGGTTDDERSGIRQPTRPQPRKDKERRIAPPIPSSFRLVNLVRTGLLTNPWVIATLIIIAILLLFFFLGFGDLSGPNPPGSVPVSINKSVDKTEVKNPSEKVEDITYTLTVSYPGTATDVIVEDPIPEGAEYVSSDPQGKTLDKAGKDTTEAKLVQKVTWSLKDIQHSNKAPTGSTTPTQGTANIDYQKYTKSPYNLPTPNGPSDIDYTAAIMANLNTLGNAVAKSQSYLTSKYDAKYVDPFLSVIWVGAIEGTLGDPYSWNCQDNHAITINDGCAGGYYSGGWQVGYGIQVSQAASHIIQDFNVAYGDGSADNAGKVADVGQQVIDNSANSSKGKITNPSSFPQKNLTTLVSEANSGNTSSQQALAILLMDPSVGAITIAQEVAGDIAANDNWSGTMAGWSGYYSSNMQNFSNRMKAIAEKYTGEGGGGGGGGNQFSNQTLKLTVHAKDGTKDTYLVNQATAHVLGAESIGPNPGNPIAGFQYYCQGDPQWNKGYPGGVACLANAGCGPTSLAMVMSTFGVNTNPKAVDDVFQANSWRQGCDGGSNYGDAISSNWFTNQGFTVGPNVAPNQQPDLQLMKQFLDNGYLIYNGADNYPCLGCINKGMPVGHVFVIDAVDVGTNRIHVRDPNNCDFATGAENPDETRWLSLDHGYPGGVQGTTWNGSFPIKKE